MAIADHNMGAAAEFIGHLRQSQLVERGELERLIADAVQQRQVKSPTQLAAWLVAQEALTPFQAERILNGQSLGMILGAYVLQDVVGSGSMGSVYRAVSKNDGKTYAVKLLPRRDMWKVAKARRYVRAFEQVKQPAVVPFRDLGTSGQVHYLVWDFAEGEPLSQRVQREGPLAAGFVAHLAVQIAEGLHACHDHALVHRLIGPSNVMVTGDGRARILDSGVGAVVAESNGGPALMHSGGLAGLLTSGLDCASPESLMAPETCGEATDQYSLGCTLYYCLSGRFPFEGAAIEKMMAHQREVPTPVEDLNPRLPPGMAVVIERLMEKEPNRRFAGMADVVEALRPFAEAPRRIVKKPAPSGPRLPDRRTVQSEMEIDLPEPAVRSEPVVEPVKPVARKVRRRPARAAWVGPVWVVGVLATGVALGGLVSWLLK